MPIPIGVLAQAGAAAGAAGAFDLLQTTLISTDTASVTFDSLSSYSAYKHLQIRMVARGNTNTVYDGFIRFNGATTGYAWHMLNGFGSGINSQNGTNQGNMIIGLLPGTGNGTNVFGVATIDILDFSATSKNKTIKSLSGTDENAIRLVSGFYNSTNAITSIELRVQSNASFVSGSRISLYGIK